MFSVINGILRNHISIRKPTFSCPLTHNWELGNKCFNCRNTMASSSLLGKSHGFSEAQSHYTYKNSPVNNRRNGISQRDEQTIILYDKRPLFTNITLWTTSAVATRCDRGVVELKEENQNILWGSISET